MQSRTARTPAHVSAQERRRLLHWLKSKVLSSHPWLRRQCLRKRCRRRQHNSKSRQVNCPSMARTGGPPVALQRGLAEQDRLSPCGTQAAARIAVLHVTMTCTAPPCRHLHKLSLPGQPGVAAVQKPEVPINFGQDCAQWPVSSVNV